MYNIYLLFDEKIVYFNHLMIKDANNKSLTSIVMDKKSFTIITKLKSKKNTKESKCLEKVETVEEEVELVAKPFLKKEKKLKKTDQKVEEENKKSQPEEHHPVNVVKQTVPTENKFKHKMNLNLNFDFDRPNLNKTKPSTPNKKEETNNSIKSSFSLNDNPSPKKASEPLTLVSSNMKKYANPFSWKLSSPGDCINPALKKGSNNKMNHNLKRSRTIGSDDDEENCLDNENNLAKRSKC
jgi:hypothetical protein